LELLYKSLHRGARPHYRRVLHRRCGQRRAGGQRIETGWGLLRYSPIARGFEFSHYEDFGSARNFGYRRVHLGNDLLGAIGTPSSPWKGASSRRWAGTVRRLAHRHPSFDGQRYYYYAHLRKTHPFNRALDIGSVVNAGDVIGYMGMTGYSTGKASTTSKSPTSISAFN
jgi:hypothetical protein